MHIYKCDLTLQLTLVISTIELPIDWSARGCVTTEFQVLNLLKRSINALVT